MDLERGGEGQRQNQRPSSVRKHATGEPPRKGKQGTHTRGPLSLGAGELEAPFGEKVRAAEIRDQWADWSHTRRLIK